MKKFIVIGAGRQMMKDHVPSIMENADCKIVSVVEPNPVLLQQAAQTIGCSGFTKLDDAIRYEKPDAAIVCVPHNQYMEILKKLAELKIATLKEKPLSMTAKEGQEIIGLYAKNHTYIQICVQRRFSNLYDTSKLLIGRIGNIYSLYAEYTLNLLTLDQANLGWRADRNISGGGATLDLGYHTIDLLTHLFGMPEKIYAQLNFNSLPGNYTIDDSMKAMCTYNNSTINANLFVTKIFRRKGERVRIFGSEGYVTVDNRTVGLYDRNHTLIESHSFNTKEHEVDNQLKYFLSRVGSKVDLNKEKILQDQLSNMKIIDAIYESDKSKALVRF